ncbi:apoptosis regulator BAX-like [Aplochiton taeniatus]
MPVAQEVQNNQEKKIITQIAEIIGMIGDKMLDDQELNNAIDKVTSCDNVEMPKRFWGVVSEMFSDGEINWGRIAVVIYMAGRVAVKLIEDKLIKLVEGQFPPIVGELLKQMVSFFKARLLCWVQENGGWINCFSALANRLSSMDTQPSCLLLLLLFSLPIVSIITWRVARGT